MTGIAKFSSCSFCIGRWMLIVLLSFGLVTPVLAEQSTDQSRSKLKSGYDNDEGLAAPGSTSGQLEEDDIDKEPVMRFPAIDEALTPWFEFKKELNDKHGLQLGMAYTVLHQNASDVMGDEDSATSHVFRLSGKWDLVNRGEANKGFLVFSVDNRSEYTDIAPNELAGEAGYIGQSGALFGDLDTILGDLYYVQYFNEGNSIIVAGRYDPNDFFDVLGYANPWTSFQNLAVLFNTSIGLADWSTGVGYGQWFENKYYFSVAANDANGVATESEFEFDTDELYKTAEFGWSPSRQERYLKNVHVMYWEVDEREDAGVDDASGYTIGVNWTWDEEFMLFGKYGSSDVDAPNDPQIYEESITVGGMYRVRKRADLIGLGINNGSFATSALDDQTTTELFYRIQLAENFAVTPSIQLLKDPALNPDEDSVTIYGVRMRLSL